MLARFYREARRRYGLSASEAFAYARDRLLIWTTDVTVVEEVDVDGEVVGGHYRDLVILLLDHELGEVVGALGGVQIDFDVSDHGNINFDEHDPFYVGIVAGMIRDYETEREAGAA